ncbi:MAG TPA: hypothetical protein DCE42_17890, partial [Myxococcales bacterium]|nr:hypothetical protein [Myxococcales bacterium]
KCASKIDSTKMLENQQGQKTNALGMYKFTLPVSAFAYRIVVRPGDPSLAFPSDKLRFQSQTAKYDAAKSGQIVTQAKPNLQNQQESRDYHVTFSVEEEGKVIQNNHIPLDFWRNLLILTKKASKRVVTVGDIITYTLTLENRSPAELKYDPKTKLGGIYFTDILPRGFRLLPLSVKMTRADGKVVLPIAKPLVTTKDGKRQETLASRLLRYGPFTLPGQSTLTLRYQTVVKPNLPIGQYVNIAYVHNEAGTALSEQAKAVVQVSYDPIFDQGTVLGKVFCDKNSNRKQEATDVGIQGVRLYLDNGHYAVTDMFGKYHIQGIDPGNHLLKIDKQTLPPGSKLIDTPYQIFYTTRGLVRKINYAVSCRSATSGIQKVMLTNKKAIQLGYKKKIIPPKPLTLKGSVYGPRLTLNGSQRALPVSNLAVSKPNDLGDYSPNAAPDFPTKKGRLTHPLVFHIRVAAGVRPANWRLAIYRRGVGNKMGNMVHSMRGVGTPPPFIKWNGRNGAGKRVLGARKQYVARFTLSTLDGSLSQSAPRVFGVGVTSVPNKVLFSRRFPGRWMGRRGIRVRGRLRRSLRRLRRKLRKLMKRPDTSLYVEVHHHNRLRRQRALFLTVRRAASLLTYMKRLLKVKEERIISQGFGSSKPKLPNITRRNRRQNLRIIVRVEQKMKPTKSSLTPLSFNAKVLLNDLSLPLDKRGRFSHTLKPPFNKKTRLRIWTPQGHHIDLSLFKLQKVPTLPRKMSHRYRFKRQWKRSLRNWRRTLRKRRQLASGKTGQHYPVLHPSVVFSKDRLLFSFKEAANHIAQKDKEARPLFSLSLASSRSKQWKRKWLAQAKTGGTLRTAPPKRTAVKSKKPTQKKGVAPWKTRAGKGKTPKANAKKPKARKKPKVRKKPKKPQFMTVPVAKAKDVLASRLRIKLPPQGAVIRTDSIRLSGITHPTNKLKINGVDIKTDKKGHFSANVPVKHGQKKLRVVTIDTEGNKGLIEWPVAVNLNRMFLMAFAEATFGAGNNRLEGLTSIAKAEGNGLLFHGRAALYVKGQMQGKHILKKLFKKIRYTAYIDTPKRQALENFYQQLIDPERYYPIYGDSGQQVQDVKARGFRFTGPGDQQYHFPVYVLVEADRSKLLVGNFRTELKGIELNRYDRTFYGVDIDFKKRFAKHFDTRVRVFLSDGDQEQMRAHVQLRGTGGSLYYLRHSSIIEGSEQIRLTIRDKDSGIILKTIPLQRNQDYVIQYFDGRVFFKHPVTSVVDSFIITQHNLHMTLDGNPVFIEA